MEDFDKYLDRLVENFYDTGKLVLNEIKNSPEMTKLRKDYDSLTKRIEDGVIYYQVEVDSLKNKWDELTTHQKGFFEKYNHDEFDLKLDSLDLSNVVRTDEIEKDLNNLISIGIDYYNKKEYQNSIDSYRKVIDTYVNLPDDIKSIKFINDIKTLEGWIKKSEGILSSQEEDIKNQRIYSNPKMSKDFYEKWREENSELLKTNPNFLKKIDDAKTEEEVKKVIEDESNEKGEEFNEKLKQKFIDDNTYIYGYWVTQNEQNDEMYINDLTRTIVKDSGRIKTIITDEEVRNSVREFLLSFEIRNLVTEDQGITNLTNKLSHIGRTLCYLINSGLLIETDLPKKGEGSAIKNQILQFKKFLKVNPLSVEGVCGEVTSVEGVLNFLGLNEIDSLPIEYKKTVMNTPADDYEKSFAELCNDEIKYFALTPGMGNSSRISNIGAYNKDLKRRVEGDDIEETIVNEIYDTIVTDRTIKYDLKTLEEVILTGDEGDFQLNNGDFVEVKDSPYENEYHLIEFYGVFKNIYKEEREGWMIDNGTKFDNVLQGLVDRLNVDLTGTTSGKGYEIIKSINDVTKGIFFSDYYFLPKDSYNLSWSTDGQRTTDARLTVRVKWNNGPFYRWIEGNCHLQQNESTDRIDNIIENFFDTGKFVI